jgi:hypothetical protein
VLVSNMGSMSLCFPPFEMMVTISRGHSQSRARTHQLKLQKWKVNEGSTMGG